MVRSTQAVRPALLLFQTNNEIESRMFYDFPSVEKSLEFLVSEFEAAMRQEQSSFTYDLRSLYVFIDNFPELFVLVYTESSKSYVPYGKQWIKSRVHRLLLK